MPQHTHTHTQTWKPIPGYEGIYEASNHGNIRSLDRTVEHINGYNRTLRGRTLQPVTNPRHGHLTVVLSKNGIRHRRYIHQLVMEAFVGPRPHGQLVRHLDDNPTNNHLQNLAYGTQTHNMQDALTNGRNRNASKPACKRGHTLAGDNIIPSKGKHGWRACKACNRAQSYVYYHPELKASIQQLSDAYYKKIEDQDNAA